MLFAPNVKFSFSGYDKVYCDDYLNLRFLGFFAFALLLQNCLDFIGSPYFNPNQRGHTLHTPNLRN